MTGESSETPAESSAAAAAPSTYTVAEADLERDREGILDVWRRNLPDKEKAGDKLDWYYRSNPLGSGRIWTLISDSTGAIVGTAGLGWRQLKIGDSSRCVGLNSDFAVDPAHRSLLPALKMLKAVLAGLPDDAAFAYCVPNQNAAPLMKRVGFTPLGSLRRHARVLQHSEYLRRIPRIGAVAPILAAPLDLFLRIASRENWTAMQGAHVRQVKDFDERFDRFWEQVGRRFSVAAERSAAFLHWRYNLCPLQNYRCIGLWTAKEDRLLGFAVYYVDDSHMRLVDLIAEDSGPVLRRLLAAAISAGRKDGVKSISLSVGEDFPLTQELREYGFVPREDTGGANAIVAYFRPDVGSPFEQTPPAQWYFVGGDEDYN